MVRIEKRLWCERLVSAERLDQFLTIRVKHTNRSSHSQVLPLRRGRGDRLEFVMKTGLISAVRYQCDPPHSSFWVARGTYGEGANLAEISINPGMSGEYWIGYAMPAEALDRLQSGDLREWLIWQLALGIKGRSCPHLFTDDVFDASRDVVY